MHEVPYAPPLRDIEFILHEWLEIEAGFAHLPTGAGLDRAAIDILMRELADFARSRVAPLNAGGDAEGCTFDDGNVRTPAGFAQAYADFCERGWSGLGALAEHGGRALPNVVTHLVTELFGSANHAWLMYGSMSRGAYECIRANGTAAQQAAWLPHLASGRWTGSMCITEAQAGTDVGLLQTTATRQADGRWHLSGLKRMATNAEHDLSQNIVHLVLARAEGAAAGTRGLSLFLVPKYLARPGDDAPLRNAVRCEGLEDKMGIRGTPTCWMRFDRAEGELLGREGQGLAAMFVMMNIARLGTGMQGTNQGERALQLSLAHALTRRQGRGARSDPGLPANRLIEHSDVRRMLMTQKAWVEGGRAFAYWIAWQVDLSQSATQPQVRADAADLVALLTPVLKAFSTDNGFHAAVLGQQVLAGVGYLRLSGASQFVADARVGQIYEGANGIQGIDLLGRKVLADGGARLERLLGQVRATCVEAPPCLDEMSRPTAALADALGTVTSELAARCAAEPDLVGTVAHGYLRLVGHLVHSWLWLRMAQVTLRADASSPFHRAKRCTAAFYFSHLHPEIHHLLAVTRASASTVMSLAAEDFGIPHQQGDST